MKEALQLMSAGKINPSAMITHIGGITAGRDTILRLPEIPGGKKLLYTQYDLPLTAIAKFESKGRENPLYAALAEICARHHGLWNLEAERYLLDHGPKLPAP
jgi:hypothetical protein